MKKRSIMLGSAVLLAVLLVVGGTMAWFTDSKEVANVFKAGTVDIILHDENGEGNAFEELSNVNPGDTHPKVVYVENDGPEDIYVRVQLIPAWIAPIDGWPEGFQPDTDLATYPTSDNWKLINGWYYYTGKVEPGEITDKLIEKVKFAGLEMDNEYQGATFTLKVEAQGIQAKNDAINDLWKVNPNTWTAIPVAP